jgi:hypothetical protein
VDFGGFAFDPSSVAALCGAFVGAGAVVGLFGLIMRLFVDGASSV